MPVAYVYSRFSSESQSRGDSLRRQLDAAQAYADKHRLHLETAYVDSGVSGFTGLNRLRGALASLLARVDCGEIEAGSYLLIDSFDRLTREAVTTAVNLFTTLLVRGVVIVTLNDQRRYDATSDMMDILYAVMSAARSHEESREKGRKISQAKQAALARARTHGAIVSSKGPTWLRLEDGRWVILEARAALVKSLFEQSAGGASCLVIARRLNMRSIPTFRGGRGWHPTSVRQILRNSSAMGDFQPFVGVGDLRRPSGAPIVGYYPAVVSSRLFDAVQARFPDGNCRRASPGARFTNLLRGFVWCAGCGGTIGIVRSDRSDGKPARLGCLAYKRKVGCSNSRTYHYPDLEAAVFKAIREHTPQGEEPDDAAALSQRLQAAQEKLSRLIDLAERGVSEAGARAQAAQAEVDKLLETARRAGPFAIDINAKRAGLRAQAAIAKLHDRILAAEGPRRARFRSQLALLLERVVDRIDCLEDGKAQLRLSGGRWLGLEPMVTADCFLRAL